MRVYRFRQGAIVLAGIVGDAQDLIEENAASFLSIDPPLRYDRITATSLGQ